MNQNNSNDMNPFDPYRTWLGLETDARPPDHYELLGLSRYEADLTVISNAVERQTAVLQMVTGADQDLVNSIVAEVGHARSCLLDPNRKSDYDQQLREAADVERLSEALSNQKEALEDLPGNDQGNDQAAVPSPIDVAAIEELVTRDERASAKSGTSHDSEVKRSVTGENDVTVKSDVSAGGDGISATFNEDQSNGAESESSANEFKDAVEADLVRGLGSAETSNIIIDTGSAKKDLSSVPPAIPKPEISEPGLPLSENPESKLVVDDSGAQKNLTGPVPQNPDLGPFELGTKNKELGAKNKSDHDGPVPHAVGTPATKRSESRGQEIPSIPQESPGLNDQIKSDSGLTGLDSDLHSARVESQKMKEAQDQQFKVIMDKVLWASCGVALVAIIWVMIVRVSGCNREPVQIVNDEGSESDVRSKKLTPKKELDLSLKSPLEKSAQASLKRSQNKKQPSNKNGQTSKDPKSNSSGKSKSAKSKKGTAVFVPIEETIGFYDFNDPVNQTDLLAGLAPLRLKAVSWKRQGKGGHISLTDKSEVLVDRDDAFDNLKELTFVCKFQCSKENGTRYLVSFKQMLVIALEKGRLKIGTARKLNPQPVGNNLSDGKWHRIAILQSAKEVEIWLDGKFQKSWEMPFPNFKLSAHATTIGRLDDPTAAGIKQAKSFIGSLDNLGFYWTKLSEEQIRSQFAR